MPAATGALFKIHFMQIKIDIPGLIYIIVAMVCAIGIGKDVFTSINGSGGWFSSSKSSGEIGCAGMLWVFGFLIFTLIFGGIFWW